MADDRRYDRSGRRSDKHDHYHPQYSGQGGSYGQSGPSLGYRGVSPPLEDRGTYRVPPSKEGGGYHHGAYAAQHYHGRSEHEPGSSQDQTRAGARWSEGLPNH